MVKDLFIDGSINVLGQGSIYRWIYCTDYGQGSIYQWIYCTDYGQGSIYWWINKWI